MAEDRVAGNFGNLVHSAGRDPGRQHPGAGRRPKLGRSEPGGHLVDLAVRLAGRGMVASRSKGGASKNLLVARVLSPTEVWVTRGMRSSDSHKVIPHTFSAAGSANRKAPSKPAIRPKVGYRVSRRRPVVFCNSPGRTCAKVTLAYMWPSLALSVGLGRHYLTKAADGKPYIKVKGPSPAWPRRAGKRRGHDCPN